MPGYGDSARPSAAVPPPLNGELRLCGVLSSHVGDAKRLRRLRQCLESVLDQTQNLGKMLGTCGKMWEIVGKMWGKCWDNVRNMSQVQWIEKHMLPEMWI